jgi:hypothetical protein
LHHAHDKDVNDLNNFIDELPKNLAGKTAWYIHEETWKQLKFINDYDLHENQQFLAWLAMHLRPCLMSEDTELFHEKDQVREIFFLMNGNCFFQLSMKMPSSETWWDQVKYAFRYIQIEKGLYFGVIDIIGSIMKMFLDDPDGDYFEKWYDEVERLFHQFNVTTGPQTTDLLSLSIHTLWKMRTEFFEEYQMMFNIDRMRGLLHRCH